jgi:hypothetical protein
MMGYYGGYYGDGGIMVMGMGVKKDKRLMKS